MAIARIDEFIEQLKPLTTLKEIKALCNKELDYLRDELSIDTKYSKSGFPISVVGDARRLNRHSFDAVAVIEKALELLESFSYISKIAGLYLLTGRRHEEILITGKFDEPFFDTANESLISEWLDYDIESALFSGQVKRKSKEDIPYNIPLLAPLDTIQTVIEWLRINKPHNPGQRPKGSKELGEKVRKIFQDSKLLPIPSGKDVYLNPHNLRSAYSAICWQLFRNSEAIYNCTEDLFVKEIMGHVEQTTESAQSYLDYELDHTEVEKLLNYYG